MLNEIWHVFCFTLYLTPEYTAMKKIRLAIQIVFLVCLIISPLFSLGYQQGTPILQSVGSCSGVSTIGGSLSSDESGEESTGSFITGEPVDIPAPVAKGIDGVDPTSVVFEAAGSGSLTKPSGRVLAQTGNSLGTLSGATLGGGSETVVLYFDGAEADRTTASGGTFSFALSEIDEPYALTVEASNGDNSFPVIVTISEVHDQLVASVSITNIASGTSSFDGEIQERESAFDGTLIAFNVRDSADTPLIATVTLDDLEPQTLVSDIGVELDFLTYADTTLFGVDADNQTGLIYRILADGTTFDDSGNLTRPPNRNFCISPDLEWMASNIDTVQGANPQMVIVLDSLVDPGISITVPTSAPEPNTVTNLICDWVDNTSMIVSKQYQDQTYTIQFYDLANVINGSATNVTPEELVQPSPNFIGSLDADPAFEDRLVCQRGPSISDVQVWRADPIDGIIEIFDDPVMVGPPRYNANGSGVIFELNTDGNTTDTANNAIVFVNSDTLEATYLAKGVRPTPSPTDKNIIVYLAPVNDTLQISILNLDHFNL